MAALSVLIVGAGPTGLTLAAQLQRHGLRFRIVDKLIDRGRESRALAVQARSLEILQQIGCADALVERGRAIARVMIHFDDRAAVAIPLGEIEAPDTRYPFILFVSQAETEAVLTGHLHSTGVAIERGVELVSADTHGSDCECVLRHPDGREERIRCDYLVGCDGAHSTVRKVAGLPFEGGDYPQEFMLGDVEVDGPLGRDTVNAFPRGPGLAIFFPLGTPRSWRVVAMAADQRRPASGAAAVAATLQELQLIVDASSGGSLRLSDPAWITRFRLHHRQTGKYRAGSLFLAGDAAHIHSPVGGQGMNTGIQDAWNLGWKLALVAQGLARPELLDSYEAERWPVGRFLLRVTDRMFTLVTSAATNGTVIAWIKRTILPWVLARLVAARRLRTLGFRFVSQLDTRYRSSPSVCEGEPRLMRGPRAGDRFPDARVTYRGEDASLLQVLGGPTMHLLLCGSPHFWDDDRVKLATTGRDALVRVSRLTRESMTGALIDETGEASNRLAVDDTAQYLIRPDGHIAYRCAGTDLTGVINYLDYWFPGKLRRHAASSQV